VALQSLLDHVDEEVAKLRSAPELWAGGDPLDQLRPFIHTLTRYGFRGPARA